MLNLNKFILQTLTVLNNIVLLITQNYFSIARTALLNAGFHAHTFMYATPRFLSHDRKCMEPDTTGRSRLLFTAKYAQKC